MDVAHDESDRLFLATFELPFASEAVGCPRETHRWEILKIALKAVNTEISPAGGEVGLSDLFHQGTRHTAIISC